MWCRSAYAKRAFVRVLLGVRWNGIRKNKEEAPEKEVVVLGMVLSYAGIKWSVAF